MRGMREIHVSKDKQIVNADDNSLGSLPMDCQQEMMEIDTYLST